jgi:hypothetical protein
VFVAAGGVFVGVFVAGCDVFVAVGVFVDTGVFVAVLVGVSVEPGGGVLVAVFVGVLVAVFVGVLVAVFVGVLVAVFVGVLVAGTPVLVAVAVLVGVFVLTTPVGVAVGVFVRVGVAVAVFVGVFVRVGVAVAVFVGVFVRVDVAVFVGVFVPVGVGVEVAAAPLCTVAPTQVNAAVPQIGNADGKIRFVCGSQEMTSSPAPVTLNVIVASSPGLLVSAPAWPSGAAQVIRASPPCVDVSSPFGRTVPNAVQSQPLVPTPVGPAASFRSGLSLRQPSAVQSAPAPPLAGSSAPCGSAAKLIALL